MNTCPQENPKLRPGFGLAALLPALAATALAAPAPHEDASAATAPPAPPRITLIVIDDVDWTTWNSTHKPHIDALAAQGVVFTQAWGYPTCSPARAALLTGRHAWRTGMGTSLHHSQALDGLALEEITLAELLPEPCEAFGKWHLGHGIRDPYDQGFGHYAGAMNNLSGKWGPSYFDWTKVDGGLRSRETRYATDVTTDDALASAASFRLVAYHAMHQPVHNPPGGTAGDLLGRKREMLGYLDREIGRLLANDSGYVLLMSDNNGGAPGPGGGKGSVRESGVHIPLIVKGPGIAPAVRDDLVSIVDVFATVADLRGVPHDAGQSDSVSLLPILAGGAGARTLNYVERFEPNNVWPLANRVRAIRDRDYKLIVDDVAGTVSLYSMPGEVEIPAPWSGDDLRAAAFLRSRMP